MNTPRCFGGSACSTRVTASRTPDASATARSGSESAHQPVGAGISHGTSSAGTSGALTSIPAAVRSRGSGRRGLSRSRSTHTLRAIRYTQVDRAARSGRYEARLRQARSSASCTASSASNGEPSI